MPIKDENKRREYNKILLRNKRAVLYKKQDELSVVAPCLIKYKDGSNSIFTINIPTTRNKRKIENYKACCLGGIYLEFSKILAT
jgi:hypothetical protein